MPDAAAKSTQAVTAGDGCTTTITYGSAWLHGANHPSQVDVVAGDVTWDGTCIDSGANSYAVLSNGWTPNFQGNGACIIAIDYAGSCSNVPASCTTLASYGAAWLPPPNHPKSYDDVTGRVFSDGVCHASGANSYENLSNGWTPIFGDVELPRVVRVHAVRRALRQCGRFDEFPDPGVLYVGNQYVLACYLERRGEQFPIYTSPDLAHWTQVGYVFPSGQWPVWVTEFWAPEIKRWGQYVVYYAARGTDGVLAIGAASSSSPTGPFTNLGAPLIHDPSMWVYRSKRESTRREGRTSSGSRMGTQWPAEPQSTPSRSPPTGSLSDRLAYHAHHRRLPGVGERGHRGAVHDPAVGNLLSLLQRRLVRERDLLARTVASGPSPTGPFTKFGPPILVTGGEWVGPGHCSVVDTPTGDTAIIYAAWQEGCVNATGCGRLDLVDEIDWKGGWPTIPLAPSSNSRPLL